MKKFLLTTAIMLLVTFTAIAQNRTITGTVTAKEDGQPLPGVSILVKGTSAGTQTDPNGKFSLSAPSGATLAFSYIGYVTKEATVGASNVMNVVLESDAKQLGEVVVTALGISRQKKSLAMRCIEG